MEHWDSNKYPKVLPVELHPNIPVYMDSDGYMYYYTIFHLEQLTK